MSSITTTTIHDDLDGTPGASTVRFGIDGAHYAIDLTDDHAEQLRHGLATYIAKARRVSAHVAEDPAAVRAWAAANGFEVTTRGRLSVAVLTAYRNAHPTEGTTR